MKDHCCHCCDTAAAPAGHAEPAAPAVPCFKFGNYALPKKRVYIFVAAFALWFAGFILLDKNRWIALIPLVLSYALAGLPVLRAALKSLSRGFSLDENFLMSIATIGAFAVGEWEEAAGVMIFYMIGELIEDAAVNRSRSSIDALLALKPDTARVEGAPNGAPSGGSDGWTLVAADSVAVGTVFQVRAGERVPLDGIVLSGSASLDTSSLTGESAPVAVTVGAEVKSGTVSLDGVLTVRSLKTAGNSQAARIIELVEKAREAKAKPERFITAFARWYTPLVVGAAALLAVVPPLITGEPFSDWLYRALILLVISCPCALVVSVPLGYFAGIGGLSSRGVMAKGAFILDVLAGAKYVAFDKTGTLTEGKFTVRRVECAEGVSEASLFEAAAAAEADSNHPLAKAVMEGARSRGITTRPEGGQIREIAGHGIECHAATGATILAGNARLLALNGITVPAVGEPSANGGGAAAETSVAETSVAETSVAETSVYIAKDGVYYGRIFAGDAVREGSAAAVSRLNALGITETVMFTGDAEGPAKAAAEVIGIKRVLANLLPEDKLRETEKLTREGVTVFVGDGINDAPVLARSHAGIAMGAGADAAVEAADLVIMTDDPRRVPEAIERSRKTRRIVLGNIVFALGAKGVFIALAVLGMANMWLALIADVGVALVAVLNSARALR